MSEPSAAAFGIRVLTPATTKIFVGRLGSIHCLVDNLDAFANVYCLRCFPIQFPDRFIAVCHSDDKGKAKEIGVIEDLAQFSQEIRDIVQRSLHRQYYERTLVRIHHVHEEFNLLFFKVETQWGPEEFIMRWKREKALEYGEGGRVLLDIFDNRYVIPHIGDLPKSDQVRLQRYVYW